MRQGNSQLESRDARLEPTLLPCPGLRERSTIRWRTGMSLSVRQSGQNEVPHAPRTIERRGSRRRGNRMTTSEANREMKPAVILVGSDKGGVGKTTVTRTLLDY